MAGDLEVQVGGSQATDDDGQRKSWRHTGNGKVERLAVLLPDMFEFWAHSWSETHARARALMTAMRLRSSGGRL
jgi:hypothetical protein